VLEIEQERSDSHNSCPFPDTLQKSFSFYRSCPAYLRPYPRLRPLLLPRNDNFEPYNLKIRQQAPLFDLSLVGIEVNVATRASIWSPQFIAANGDIIFTKFTDQKSDHGF
jgi:hypothetical protein